MHRQFTATTFITNKKNQVLLLWHKRLKRWMPPGGHLEPNELPEEAALRECKEETGLDIEIIGEEQHDLFASPYRPAYTEGRMLKKPFAVLLEEIPACPERNEEAHQHMDFIFLGKPLDESQSLTVIASEKTDIRWLDIDQVSQMDDEVEIFTNVKEFILRTFGDEKEEAPLAG